jgi:hypothetical protein
MVETYESIDFLLLVLLLGCLINAQLQLQGKLQKGLHMTGSRWLGN